MKKNYGLVAGVIGLGMVSSLTVTYAAEETIAEMDSQVVFSQPREQNFKKMRMHTPHFEGEKETLTEEEKAEMEAKREEIRTKMKAELEEKLANGEITQEEYDQKREEIENGKMKMGGKMMRGEKETLTEEEKAEMEAKREEIRTKMQAELEEKLANGEITQEEYDTCIENLESGKVGCPMGGKRKMGAFKGENNEENKEAGQFKMMKKIGEKVRAFKKVTSEQETE